MVEGKQNLGGEKKKDFELSGHEGGLGANRAME
jgi:hypothetical protein